MNLLLTPTLALVTASVFTALPLQAATLRTAANDRRGNTSVTVDITATDRAGGIEFSLKVNDLFFTGDLVAAYFDFSDRFNVSNIKGVSNAVAFALNTDNVVSKAANSADSIGQTFDLGVRLFIPDQKSTSSATSASFNSTTFSVFGSGLDTTDLSGQTVAVYLERVGKIPDGGTFTAKQFGTFPIVDTTPPGNVIPTPALLPGLLAMGAALLRKHDR